MDQLEIDMLRSHCMNFYTTYPHHDLCHSFVLAYVTNNGSSYDNCNEGRFDPMLI